MNGLSKKLLLCFCFCFCLTAVEAQYRIDQWTADDGLPQNSVYGMVQTRDGYLWLATLDGLARFDGVRFQVFNKSNSPGIVNNRFTALFEAADGDLWAGTEESGIVRYHDRQFSHYAAGEGAGIYAISDADADGKSLTFLRGSEAMRFADGKLSRFDARANSPATTRPASRQSVRAFCGWEDPSSSFGCYANGRWLNFSPAPGEPEYKLRTAVQEADGNFWLLTDRREVVRVENGKVVRVYKAGDGLPEIPMDFITGAKTSLISWDGQDSLLLTDLETMRSELLVKTPANLAPTISDIYPPFLAGENISLSYKLFLSSYRDAEGNLWFGTVRGGLYRARKQVVKTFSTAEGLTDNVVYPIYETDDGSLLIGTTRGLYDFKDGRFAPVELTKNFYVQAIGKDPAGRIVVTDNNSLYVREANRFVPFLEGQIPAGAEIYAIHTDRENRLWIGCDKGLSRFGDGAATLFTTDSGLAGNDVKVIIDAKAGGVWIGTYGGLSRFQDGKLTSWTDKDGLPSLTIRALYEDTDGALWIGTYDGGLARFKDGKFTAYNSKIGLYTDEAFQILEDDNRNFWISSNHGIYRVSKDELNEYADGRRNTITSVAYGKSDGMLNAEANGGRSPGGIKTRDGRLWFPTQDGVAMIDPREIKINSQPPPVVIEGVKIDNNDVGFENANFESEGEKSEIQNLKSDILIEPSQQNFEIAYTALSFINSENLQFKYKLEGLDNDWINAGTRRLAYYSHVPPGSYTFRVIAANSDGVWNETGATLKITVKPPFYQMWWFSILTVFAIGTVVLLLYRRRVEKLEQARRLQEEFSRRLINANESERRRIAGELHDSIGQSLAMIKNRAMLSAESAEDENTRKQLELITAQATQTIGEVREISYALRPYLLDNLGLTKAVKSLLNNISETSELAIETELDDVDHIFDREAEMSIYRIVQESLSNILKHAEASEAQVFMKKSQRNLTVLISDDGKGFDMHAVEIRDAGKGGFGLLGISERVKILGGAQEIESQIGGGTTILIKLPVPTAEIPAN